MAVIKDISRLNKVQLSPIAETQTQIKEASFVDYLVSLHQNHFLQQSLPFFVTPDLVHHAISAFATAKSYSIKAACAQVKK